MTLGKIGSTRLVRVLDKEDEMYKEILEAMVRNTSGYSINLSGIFPYDGPQFAWVTTGLLSNGQLFRNSRFEHIDVGNCILINSYGFSSSTLKSVRCGAVGNNSTIFLQCPALTNVYIVKDNTTQTLSRTSIFNASPSAQNKQITWHCKPDGKKITWNSDTGSWQISDDTAAQTGGGYKCIALTGHLCFSACCTYWEDAA